MPSLLIPPSGVSLEGAPSSKPKPARHDIFSLSLTDNIIEDMIKCVRSGKGLQLSLGPDPKIVYGTRTQHFETHPDPFTCELYRSTVSPPSDTAHTAEDLWTSDEMGKVIRVEPMYIPNWFGMVRDTKLVPTAKKPGSTVPFGTATANSSANASGPQFPDSALAQLESSLALETAKKAQNMTKQIKDSSVLSSTLDKRRSAQSVKSSRVQGSSAQPKSIPGSSTRSIPTSPALNSLSSPAIAPTSVPLSQQQAERSKAIRRPIVHQLAVGPATGQELFGHKTSACSDAEFRAAIEKIADLEDGMYKLKVKAFKDLEVWSYKYDSQADRQLAIDNAIRAYDKLRLGRSEPEWERLLPKEERGTGKCLSKLQARIAVNGSQSLRNPKSNIHSADESGRDTSGQKEGDFDPLGKRDVKSSVSVDKGARSYSQPPASRSKKISDKEAQTKRLLAKPGKAPKTTVTKKAEKKTEKETSKFKSAEFVSDSDDDDDDAIPLAVNRPHGKAAPRSQLSAKVDPKHPDDNDEYITNDISVAKKPKKDERISSASSSVSPASRHRISDASQASHSTTTTQTSISTSTTISRPKGNTNPPQKSSPLASSPPTNATDVEESYQTSSSTSSYTFQSHDQPTLKRKLGPSAAEPSAKRHRKTPSASTMSSATSVSDQEPSSEIREKSARFKVYYDSYAQLHKELSADESRRRKEIGKLLDMQERLAKMKREILKAAGT